MIATAGRSMVPLVVLTLLLANASAVRAAAPPAPPGASPTETMAPTPARLSYIDGEVSFWRPGAQDWAPAQINTPLAPGDELYAADNGTVELQVGARAFVRAATATQFGIANQEPDFLQVKITSGHIALDVRSLLPGHSLELDTPHAAFTIDHSGYYRADVTGERTSFITRRAGQATMTSAAGQAVLVAPSEELVLEGTEAPQVQSYVAPEVDAWDQWNYARTDHFFEALSARYVSPGTYGLDELDHNGSWRVVAEYGAIWVPDGVPSGWAPYSTGRWIMDPYYGWTWVDTAPWGWAPYHYGRWVFVNSLWAWAPGPIVVRPVYAPALVAFFAAPGIRVSVDLGSAVSWVALGWGEPIVPWWGRPGFVGRPWWGGWGGPRVVNNVVVNRTTVVNVNNITVYRNTGVANAVVAVRQEHFATRPVEQTRIMAVDARHLAPVRGALPVQAAPASFVAASGQAVRPSDPAFARRVVATRQPVRSAAVTRGAPSRAPSLANAPGPRVVPPPRPASATAVPPRPPFGASQTERQRPPLPPRLETRSSPIIAATRESVPRAGVTAPPSAEHGPGRGANAPAIAVPRGSNRELPGEPANRLAPHRAQAELQRPSGNGAAGGRAGAAPAPVRGRER